MQFYLGIPSYSYRQPEIPGPGCRLLHVMHVSAAAWPTAYHIKMCLASSAELRHHQFQMSVKNGPKIPPKSPVLCTKPEPFSFDAAPPPERPWEQPPAATGDP